MSEESSAMLLSLRGDLPSAAILILSKEKVIAAMSFDTFEDPTYSLTMLQAWADKLKDREDWQDILDTELSDGNTIEDHLIWAVGQTCENPDDPTLDLWDNLGMDLTHCSNRYQELLEYGFNYSHSLDEVEAAKIKLRQQQQDFSAEVDNLRKAAEQAAEDIDI